VKDRAFAVGDLVEVTTCPHVDHPHQGLEGVVDGWMRRGGDGGAVGYEYLVRIISLTVTPLSSRLCATRGVRARPERPGGVS